MDWFFISLLPPALYAATNLLDVFLIRKVVGKVSLGALIFFTALSYAILLGIAYFNLGAIPPFESVSWWSVAAGILWTIYLVPYYQALGRYEPDIAVSYFTLIPIFLVGFGFFFLYESLNPIALLGVAIVCFGVLGASLPRLKAVLLTRFGLVFRMVLASFIVALGIVAFKLAGELSYWHNTFYFALSATGTILALYLLPQNRRELSEAFRKDPAVYFIANFSNEVLDQSAGMAMRFAQ